MEEIGRVALGWKVRAGEVADWFADDASDDDSGNQTQEIGRSGDEEGQHRVPVENVADDNVQ